MQLSVATANLYTWPFEQVLEIIAEAGFQNIELDLFWARKDWAIAQHLKDVPVEQAIRLVGQSGLRISSIHDGGGLLEDEHSTFGYVNPAIDQYLDALGYAPDCLVFHTPHIEGHPGDEWWQRTSGLIVHALEKYRKACKFVTLENMPPIDGFFVPMLTPEELFTFVAGNGLDITLDTTHYAQIGIDIVEAARKLKPYVKTIHLSDFKAGKAHVFIGEGELDFSGFLAEIDKHSLNAVTLECSLSSLDDPLREMSYNELIGRMKEARIRLQQLLQ
jgi:sugar phosphate isomerase/epimerase